MSKLIHVENLLFTEHKLLKVVTDEKSVVFTFTDGSTETIAIETTRQKNKILNSLKEQFNGIEVAEETTTEEAEMIVA